MQDIRRVLVPGGRLLCRVNSTKDVNFGAVGFPELDRHYYSVRGRSKRFFDQLDVDALFAVGWERISLEELQIDRYDKPKTVWEVVLHKGSAGRLAIGNSSDTGNGSHPDHSDSLPC